MKLVLAVLMAAATIGAFLVKPAEGFLEPDLARIVFFHLPCAFATTMFLIWGAVASARYLMSRSWHWELRASAANEMAAALAVATMATGIVFSRTQWNKWWHWDARQTSFLVVLLLLGAYFALRSAFEEPIARARASAAYSVLTLLPVLFLVFVFPNLPQVAKSSLHPQGVVSQGRFSSDYWMVVLGVFVLLMGLCVWMYRLHVRAGIAVAALADYDDGSAAQPIQPTATVR